MTEILLQTKTWEPSERQIAKRIQLLRAFEFQYILGSKLWKYKKAFVTDELINKSHDSTFIQVLQIALLQNYTEAMRKYMENSDEEPLKPI